MKVLKLVSSYFIWVIISLISALGYMRIILGPKPEPSTGIMKMFDWVYGFVMMRVGFIIGMIILFIFILIDNFYFKKSFKNNKKLFSIRFLTIIVITVIVGTIHYWLEKVIDVI